MTGPAISPEDAAHAQNELASKWMKRGIALLEQNTSASLTEAIPCFDNAIELRYALPLESNPRFRFGLAAGWMNRGDALTRLGSPMDFAEALRSYAAALTQLNLLPLDENPLFRRRLAVAWMNRGITLLGQGKNISEAVDSFEECLTVLQDAAAAGIEDRAQLLGCAWMNRANGLIRLENPDLQHAHDAAKKALEFLAATEQSDVVSAEAALKARHILCQAIGGLLAEKEPAQERDSKDLVSEATDMVDEGMKLAREWELRNVTRFRPLAGELFRFGVRAYQIFQPHFLVEFILESVDAEKSPGASPSPEMHIEAMRGIWRCFREIQNNGFNKLNPEQFEEFLQKLHELSFAENRLNQLRQGYAAAKTSSQS